MPTDEAGDKWACEPCIRGHRSTKCEHFDRFMLRVKKPGRPLSSCPHPKNQCSCGTERVMMVKIPKDSICMCKPAQEPGPTQQQTPSDSSNGMYPPTPPSVPQGLLSGNGYHLQGAGNMREQQTIGINQGYPPQFQPLQENMLPQPFHNGQAAFTPLQSAGFHGTSTYIGQQQSLSNHAPVNGDASIYSNNWGIPLSNGNTAFFDNNQHSTPTNYIPNANMGHAGNPGYLPPGNFPMSQQHFKMGEKGGPGFNTSNHTQFQAPPNGNPNIFNMISNYATVTNPLYPEQYAFLQHHMSAAPPSLPADTVSQPTSSVPYCGCGQGCHCVGCAVHPYNEESKNTVLELEQMMEFDATNKSSRPQSHHGRSPSASQNVAMGFTHSNDGSLPSPAMSPGIDHDIPFPTAVDPSLDYYHVSYPAPGCSDNSGTCQCGNDCACVGCLTHSGHTGEILSFDDDPTSNRQESTTLMKQEPVDDDDNKNTSTRPSCCGG